MKFRIGEKVELIDITGFPGAEKGAVGFVMGCSKELEHWVIIRWLRDPAGLSKYMANGLFPSWRFKRVTKEKLALYMLKL